MQSFVSVGLGACLCELSGCIGCWVLEGVAMPLTAARRSSRESGVDGEGVIALKAVVRVS